MKPPVVFDASVGLALLASVSFGLTAVVVNAGLKFVSGDSNPGGFVAAFVSIGVSAFVFWGTVLFRGTTVATDDIVPLLPFVLAGVLYPALFRFLYFNGIDRVGPSIAGGIVAANPIIAAVLAVPLLGERLGGFTAVGLACIVAGGVVLQFVKRTGSDQAAAPTDIVAREISRATPRDALYPVGAAVAIGCGYVLIKFGLLSFSRPVVAMAVTQTTALVVFIGVIASSSLYRRRVREGLRNRTGTALFGMAGLIVAVAWFGQFAALQQGSVVVVVPLVNTFPLVIVGITYALARRLPRNPYVIAGLLLIIVGANVVRLS